MSIFKRIKQKHPDVGYLYAAIILLALHSLVVTLIFTIPRLMMSVTPTSTYTRTISPSNITSTTSLTTDKELIFIFDDSGVNEVVKLSSDASSVFVGPYNANKYVFKADSTSNYNIDIDYTVTGLSVSNIRFEVILSDDEGNNQVTLNESEYVVTPKENGASLRYSTTGETHINKVTINYQK